MRRFGRVAGLILGLLGAAEARASEGVACRSDQVEGARYTICEVDLGKADLRLFHAGADGAAFGSFRALKTALAGEGLALPFAMNAGMYHEDLSPVGLFIEDGKEVTQASTKSGPGNFHLLPNGVFWIGDGRAGVVETKAYLAKPPKARFATQSGPMLVIGGKLHPKFRAASDSRKIRNGVGVIKGGRAVVFALSEAGVTFHAFATLFRDHIGARDALFLDGSISSLHSDALGRSDGWFPMGPIVGVVEKR
jgi:uncharacterized protein YigE (DUF2233 family)